MINNTILMEQLNQYYDAWLQYNNVYEEWAKAHGLSVNCLLVLCAIYDSGNGCTQKKISGQWLIPKQTIHMVSKDLQRKGFVELSPLPEDKRNKIIRFTKEGKEYADTIVNALRKVELSVIEEIDMERMQQLNDSMSLFAKLFYKAGGITGLVPVIRNQGGSFYAMVSIITGFVTNIILDYLFVWIFGQGVSGAAWATVIGQGVTMLTALVWLLRKKQFTMSIPFSKFGKAAASILKIGIAPFGLTMSPNISLTIINRFSVSYGGEQAVAVYACIAYAICIVYLILQGVGDGSQPLLSRYYGEGNYDRLKSTRKLAYVFALFLSLVSCIIMYLTKGSLGALFGASDVVNAEIAKIMPLFLVSVPFVAVLRITTASFYATEKSVFSYVLTFMEPLLMFVLMLILPPLFGGQIMIWWSTVFARILSAVSAFILKRHVDKRG